MTEHVGRFALVRQAIGDVGPEESARIAEHLAGCDTCRRIVEEIRADVATYEESAELQFEQIRARLPRARREPPARRRWLSAAGLALAATAAAAVMVVVLPADAEIQLKGQLSVQIVAKRDSRQFRVEGGELMRAGDQLRFIVTVSQPGYLVILSKDSRGTVSLLYPDPHEEEEPLRLARQGANELPGSIILDDAPGYEIIVVAYSPEPFELAPLRERLAQLAGEEVTAQAFEAHRDRDTKLEIVRLRKAGRFER